MNSQGSSSKCPSSSSLSTPVFLLSESEQTEDDADVFAKEKGESRISKACTAEKDRAPSGRYSDLLAHSHQLHTSSADNNQSKHCSHKTKHHDLPTSPGAATQGSSSATPGDLIFAQKCADLQRFVHPLLELLHGLKTGRFHKGLTSFQQSVAMDRLHRILGILQKPEMGERYLQNLLQIEMMLKMWFPQVALQSADTPNQTTTPKLSHRWCQNQLHMPVKKRKMSWSDPDHSGTVPNKHKHLQDERQGTFRAVTALDTVSTCLPGSLRKHKAPKRRTVEPAGPSCEFRDSTGTSSALSDWCCKKENENQKRPEVFPPSPCDSLATQDSSVSSSTAPADSP
ncbi:circadian associated repressor of transcription a [Sphaeramia orbicularis]|nr:uncharacterized protein LOC115428813 [Sphaeramia orbicularis]